MFEDVPELLNKLILGAPKRADDRPFHFLMSAALVVVSFYLPELLLANREPPFFFDALPPKQGSEQNWHDWARLNGLAQFLFELRHQPGFAELCRRLGKKPTLRSAFYEASAAEMFQRRRFLIYAKAETQTRGQDFDFSIRATDVEANVEVTEITAASFNEKAIRNKLHEERKQLPSDQPGVIVCFLPGTWRLERDINPLLEPIARRFFGGTQRINHLLFVEDLMLDNSNGAGGMTTKFTHGFRNTNARHVSPTLDKMMVEPTAISSSPPIAPSGSLKKGFWGQSEFFEWVDWLLVRSSNSVPN